MASDHSHLMTGVGRRPIFALGLLVAVLAPTLAGAPFEASSVVTAALVTLALALTSSFGRTALTVAARPVAAAQAAGSASYVAQRVSDPQHSPRRPRAPEHA